MSTTVPTKESNFREIERERGCSCYAVLVGSDDEKAVRNDP